MALSIRDPETEKAVRQLAQLKGKSLTETIREAVENETKLVREKIPLSERIKAIQDELAKYPRTGLKADKAFYDELWGDE